MTLYKMPYFPNITTEYLRLLVRCGVRLDLPKALALMNSTRRNHNRNHKYHV